MTPFSILCKIGWTQPPIGRQGTVGPQAGHQELAAHSVCSSKVHRLFFLQAEGLWNYSSHTGLEKPWGVWVTELAWIRFKALLRISGTLWELGPLSGSCPPLSPAFWLCLTALPKARVLVFSSLDSISRI